MPKVERVPTGIPGFDKLVEGGFVKYSTNLISGNAGTGKSIFAMQFLYNGANKFNEKGLYISCEEHKEDLLLDAKQFGWEFTNKVKFVYFSPYSISNFLTQIENEIDKTNAQRVVIDSTSVIGMSMKSEHEVRQAMYDLAKQLRTLKCTALLTAEMVGDSGMDSGSRQASRFGVEEFVADSVITLHYLGLGGRDDRSIRVLKMRRTKHKSGPAVLEIGNKGMTVKSD